MIEKIYAINFLGERIDLELRRPYDTGLLIENIEGLGPPEANINISEKANGDGGLFNSANVGNRNIVISFKFVFPVTVNDIESVRALTYRYFPIRRKMTFGIVTNHKTLEVEGYVESNEATIFDEQSGCTISIICPDPYFRTAGDNSYVTTVFYGIENLFEFPYSNESVTEDLTIYSEIKTLTTNTVHYEGTGDVGILIDILATGPISNFTMYDIENRGYMSISDTKLISLTGSPIKAGDEVHINTNAGHKSIMLRRDGKMTNILNCINRGAEWFRLNPGDNIFAFVASSGVSNIQLSIRHQTAYEGV